MPPPGLLAAPAFGGSTAPSKTELIGAAHVRRLPQEDHADLGLIDDDDTPDMRKPPAATEGSCRDDHPTRNSKEIDLVMTTIQPNTDNAQTWRDLADQLTPLQIADLQHWSDIGDQPGGGSSDAYREYLIGEARDHIETNRRNAELSARVQPPAGVISVGDWDTIDTASGRLTRSVQWFTHDAGPTTVDVDGFQGETGAIDGPHLSVYGLEGDGRLSADDARRLAQALTDAADELDRLS